MKKNIKKIFLITCLITATCFTAHAANEGKIINTQSYVFEKSAVYDVNTQAGYVSAINLSPEEEILYIGCGDSSRWLIENARAGENGKTFWQILIKPLKNGLTTNLIINTNKRSYQINLIASSDIYNPYVDFIYSDEQKINIFSKENFQNIKMAEKQAEKKLAPAQLNFNYKIENKKFKWKPLQVFDDGNKTFLLMPKVEEAPVLYMKRKNKISIVNYRVKDKYYIIDRLVDGLELRLGKDAVEITSTKKDIN